MCCVNVFFKYFIFTLQALLFPAATTCHIENLQKNKNKTRELDTNMVFTLS